MLESVRSSFEDMAGMVLLSRAVKDPKSSVAMNEWLDEKLNRRFEDFSYVTTRQKNMIHQHETQNKIIIEENAGLRNEIKALRDDKSQHLKTLSSQHSASAAKSGAEDS
jgi:hypothetical protein